MGHSDHLQYQGFIIEINAVQIIKTIATGMLWGPHNSPIT